MTDLKKGIISIPAPVFSLSSKVNEAYIKHFLWQREVWYEVAGHENFKGYTAKVAKEIRELKESMTDEEKKEFYEKIRTR